MRTLKTVREDTKIILSHLAITLNKPHEETCPLVEKDGFDVAYDGMKIEF